jgi:hypothetical protein
MVRSEVLRAYPKVLRVGFERDDACVWKNLQEIDAGITNVCAAVQDHLRLANLPKGPILPLREYLQEYIDVATLRHT